MDPWQGESLLIKPPASFDTRKEKIERFSSLVSPFHLNLLSLPGGAGPKLSPLIACGLLTSQLLLSILSPITAKIRPHDYWYLELFTRGPRRSKAGCLGERVAQKFKCVVCQKTHTHVWMVKSCEHSNASPVFSLRRSIAQIVRSGAKWITECFPESISITVWQQRTRSAIYHNIKTHHVKGSNKKARGGWHQLRTISILIYLDMQILID